MNNRIPYLYLIGWLNHNIWYIGCQYGTNANPDNLWNTYFTSSEYVKTFRAINGNPDVIEILKIGEIDEIIKLEMLFQNTFECHTSPNWLNRQIGREHFYNDETSITKQKESYQKNYSDDRKAAKSNLQRIKWEDGIYREKQTAAIRAARTNVAHTEEAKMKISKANNGLKRSDETKQKLKAARKSHPGLTLDGLERIKKALTGRPRSDETKNKLSKANLGKRASNETKEKMRENYVSFDDFLSFLKTVNVNSYSTWIDYVAKNPLPNNIPKNPLVAYARRGTKTNWIEIKKKYL